jgi:ABC-type transporter Mla subunit MlaD
MDKLTSNQQLYEYLQALSRLLHERGAKDLSQTVANASRTAAGNVSTEFLGESRIALNRVMNEGQRALTSQERDDVADVLKQVNGAFGRKR